MSRTDRIIAALTYERDVLRERAKADRKAINDFRAEHPACERCVGLAFDLHLARETLDDLAAQVPPPVKLGFRGIGATT